MTKCARDGCNNPTRKNGRYCSDYCGQKHWRDKNTPPTLCGCGCGQTTENQRKYVDANHQAKAHKERNRDESARRNRSEARKATNRKRFEREKAHWYDRPAWVERILAKCDENHRYYSEGVTA